MTDDINSYTGMGMTWIATERERVVLQKGYTLAHDNAEHTVEELMRIGSCYIDWAAGELEGMSGDIPPAFYPEDSSIEWKTPESSIEGAVRGAAFIASALDLFNAQMVMEAHKSE